MLRAGHDVKQDETESDPDPVSRGCRGKPTPEAEQMQPQMSEAGALTG